MRFFFVILAVDGLQVVWSLLADDFKGLVALVRLDGLLLEILAIGRTWVEFVSLREVNLLRLLLSMRVPALLDKTRPVRGRSIERMPIRVVLIILNEYFLLGYALGSILVEVLRGGVEWNILIFLLDPRNDLLPHLRLLSGVMLPIRGVYVIIRSVLLRLYIAISLTLGWRFLPGIDRMLDVLILIR